MLRYASDCGGIESPCEALHTLGVPFRHVFASVQRVQPHGAEVGAGAMVNDCIRAASSTPKLKYYAPRRIVKHPVLVCGCVVIVHAGFLVSITLYLPPKLRSPLRSSSFTLARARPSTRLPMAGFGGAANASAAETCG